MVQRYKFGDIARAPADTPKERQVSVNELVEQAIEDTEALGKLSRCREADFLSLSGNSIQRLLELLYRQLDA